MNTTETKLRELTNGVSKFKAEQEWTFYRCESCEASASLPNEIVHELGCPNRSEEGDRDV